MTQEAGKELSEKAEMLLVGIKAIFAANKLERHFKVAVPAAMADAAQELRARGLLEDAGDGLYHLAQEEYAKARLN